MIKNNFVVVIGCTKKKKNYSCAASEMYSESALFKKTVSYVNSHYSISYVILSAKHGIITPDTVIEPYDISMKNAYRSNRDYITSSVFYNLQPYDKIIALCGQDYIRAMRDVFPEKCIVDPMNGMGIGKRLKFLSDRCC